MKLYELVKQYKGVVVWEFSQKKREVGRWCGIGICSALSASWIKHHVHNDSLANHLGGGSIGKIDVFALRSMLLLQDSFEGSQGNSSYVKKWFKMHGIVPFTVGGSISAHSDIEYSIVTSLIKNYAHYAYVTFGERDKGHAAAVWLGGSGYTSGDACFFDPNVGEFWFENKQDFFHFFPAFYQARYRRTAHGAREGWSVIAASLSNKSL